MRAAVLGLGAGAEAMRIVFEAFCTSIARSVVKAHRTNRAVVANPLVAAVANATIMRIATHVVSVTRAVVHVCALQ